MTMKLFVKSSLRFRKEKFCFPISKVSIKMGKINVCYVLDCSGSMIDMPEQGITTLRNNIKDLKNVEPKKKKVIKIIEFGNNINSFDFEIRDVDEVFSNTKWKCSMGKTSLYDAIATAVLHCKQEGGLITIITDGKENDSWLTKTETVNLLRKFRTTKGKVMLIGPGEYDELRNCLDGEVDSVYALSLENVHQDTVDCLSSEEFRFDTQSLLSSIS